MKRALPILMYHGIHDSPSDRGTFDPVYSLTCDSITEQLDWLVEHGYRTRLLSEAVLMKDFSNDVVLTFDDGDISNVTTALGLLQERQMVAEFFVTSDWIGDPNGVDDADILRLVDGGMSVQSHGKSHRFLDDLSNDEIEAELRISKKRLEQASARPVVHLSLPGGRGGSNVVERARQAGYRTLCTSQLGLNESGRDPFTLRRIPVTRDIALNEFVELVTGRGKTLRRQRRRQQVLGLVKRALGNRLYGSIRERIVE